MVHYLYDKVKLKVVQVAVVAVVLVVAVDWPARKDNYFYQRLTSLRTA
jgi:hypothetical protein